MQRKNCRCLGNHICQLFVVSCSLSVGAKHLEDKLSVIAKNSSPNASPVQLSVVSCSLFCY
ncbi:MAG: hypothetical protein HEQ33_15880 [Dolichospermum sp. WA123]|nr:hypothetical protein [Dolichospermum sp. WA123]